MERRSKILYHIEILRVVQEKHGGTSTGIMRNSRSPLDGIEGEFSPKKKAFKIGFDRHYTPSRRLDVGKKYRKINFETTEEQLVFEYVWISSFGSSIVTADIDFFYTKGYSKNKKYYYRLIIPLRQKLDFHYQIEDMVYTNDLLEWSRGATKAIIAGDEFIAYTFKNESRDKDFLGIECEVKMNYGLFSEKAFALKNALGYITGHLAGDGGYFFAYEKKEMKEVGHYYYCSFRNTIKSSYTPIHTNPYSWLHDKNKIAERINKKKMLRPLTFQELSTLASKLYSSLDFSSAIILLMESSVASLLFMPGGYAIVLEALSDLIIGDDKLKLAPIKDKPKAKLLRKQLIKILASECGDLPSEDYAVLKVRIEQLNQMTNGERLKAPFNKLGIKLLEKDLEILRSRNDFLHGRVPDISKTVAEPGLEEKNRDLYYASLRFYTLLNMLILKWIGFDNYVVNYPKLNQEYCKIRLKEPYYRKL